jgi:hypothetical protein
MATDDPLGMQAHWPVSGGQDRSVTMDDRPPCYRDGQFATAYNIVDIGR